MTKRETAHYMHLTLKNLDHLIRLGRLRPVRYPGIPRFFFMRESVDVLIDRCQTRVEPPRPKDDDPWGLREISRKGAIERSKTDMKERLERAGRIVQRSNEVDAIIKASKGKQ